MNFKIGLKKALRKKVFKWAVCLAMFQVRVYDSVSKKISQGFLNHVRVYKLN